MGPLPRSSQQNEYALVICDHFTKWVEIHAMRNGTAVEVAKRLIKFFTRFGLPDQILTDQGTNFQSNVLAEVYDAFDIHKTRTSPYHPQCDGQTERFMRTLKMMISSYIDEKQRNWDVHLDLFSFAYNTATHATTKYSPFYMMYGRQPKIPLDIFSREIIMKITLTEEEYARQIEDNLKFAYEHVIANRDFKMNKAKIRHDRAVRPSKFKIGDLVWLSVEATKVGVAKKLSHRWNGPYKILNI
jgi:hypothetical protein